VKILKMVLIFVAVAVLVAMGGFFYGRTVGSHVDQEAVHEKDAHGAANEAQSHQGEKHEEHAHETGSGDITPSEKDQGREDHVLLSDTQIGALGVVVADAGPGTLETILTLPGEIILNDDAQALVTPYVSGYVKEIRKRQGDPVRRGEVMAVLESRELADAGAMYLAARERLVLAEKNFSREESLWRKKISPETDYLEARMVLSAARIEVRSTRQKLMALGLQKAAVDRLPGRADDSLTRYEIVSPLNGQVLEKNLSLGEMVESTAPVYRVADMKTVWVKITLHQNRLPYLKKGMAVLIQGDDPMGSATGTLTFIGPLVGRETRTAGGRATLLNPKGEWRPGLYVKVLITAGEERIPLLVPKKAVVTMGGMANVFVPAKGGFEVRVVTTGRFDEDHIEITSGLSPKERYVIDGAFELKATLMTEGMDSHAGHGH